MQKLQLYQSISSPTSVHACSFRKQQQSPKSSWSQFKGHRLRHGLCITENALAFTKSACCGSSHSLMFKPLNNIRSNKQPFQKCINICNACSSLEKLRHYCQQIGTTISDIEDFIRMRFQPTLQWTISAPKSEIAQVIRIRLQSRTNSGRGILQFVLVELPVDALRMPAGCCWGWVTVTVS